MDKTEVRVPFDKLKEIVRSILVSVGLSGPDAEIAADVLVTTDARGVSSHGVYALPGYVRQMREGGIDPRSDIAVLEESGATCLIDGKNGMGQVVSVKATLKAIELARKYGTSVVCVRNSSHFGAGAYYAMMCAKENQIGIAISNATPVLAAPGGCGPAVGNNPIAVAVPTADDPVVLDIALSIVAVGKMMNIVKSGGTIPDNWITDEEGRPSTDPYVLDRGGAALPFGGYKGFGIAVITEILAAVLPGAGVTKELRDWLLYPHLPTRTGHFFAAIDVSRFMPVQAFKERVSLFGEEIRGGKRAAGVERLYMPGDMENEAERKSMLSGVAVPIHLWKALKELAEEEGLSLDMEL